MNLKLVNGDIKKEQVGYVPRCSVQLSIKWKENHKKKLDIQLFFVII